MDAGKLNKLMVLYKPVDVADGQGGRTRKLVSMYTVWGSLKVPRTAIKEVQGNPGAELNYEAVLRRLPEDVTGWRLHCEGRIYDIVAEYPGYEYVTVLQIRRHEGRA